MGWSDQNVIARLVIIEGTGDALFVYNGTPTSGNLIASIASVAGLDEFGNAYDAGITSYFLAGTRGIQLNSGALNFLKNTGTGQTSGFAGLYPGIAGHFLVQLAADEGLILGSASTTADNICWICPSGDATGATDATLINAALGVFSEVQLMPGTYFINATLQIPPFCTLTGAGPLWIGTSVIEVVNGANLNAIIASQGWTTSANGTSQSPIALRDLVVNGNKANQTGGAGHGVVSQNFGSYFEDLVIVNTIGDGLRLDAFGANGSTEISNTAVENRIYRCQFRSNNGSGVRTNDNTSNQHMTDGFLVDCIVQNPLSHGVEIMCAAGWKIDGNHLYGLPLAGIWAGRIFNTRIVNNLIETWGSSASAGFYSGIDCGNLASPIADAGQGSSICNNNLAFTAAPGNAGTDIDGITCTASGGTSGSVTVTGNQIFNNQVSAARYRGGIVLQAQNATATLNAVTTGNQVLGGWNAQVDTILNGGVVNHTAGV